MFKSMKLGTKIGVGFGALILIAVALGGLAVWNMLAVKTSTTQLADESVPEVGLSTRLDRSFAKLMFEFRGYAYTGEKTFLDAGNKELEAFKKNLKEAKDFSDKAASLEEMKKGVASVDEKLQQYEQLVQVAVAKNNAMDAEQAKMDDATQKLLPLADAFSKDMKASLLQEIASTSSATQPASGSDARTAQIEERVTKLVTISDVTDLINSSRIAIWKGNANRDLKMMKDALAKAADVDKKLTELRAITRQDVNIKQLDEIKATFKAYSDAVAAVISAWETNEEVAKNRAQLGDKLLTECKSIAETGLKDVKTQSVAAASSLSTASTTMIVGLSVAILVGILMAFFITRSITGPINRIIAGMTAGAEQTASASNQVSAASQSLAQGASEQAAAIEETTSSVEEMASMTKQNAANANEAKNLAATANIAVDKGGRAMEKMSQAIEDIKKSSDQTAKIIKTIDEIAFQTNLLALNAAVEAARAGEAGKGFAVVAEEVRNLAMRSAEAAKNTASMIEQSVKNADNGVSISKGVATTLEEIATGNRKVNDLVGEIAAASNEQAQGIEQISTAVGQMDSVTQQNAANAEESASASEELSAQAEELNKMVGELQALVSGNSSVASSTATANRKAHAAHSVATVQADKPGAKAKAKGPKANRSAEHTNPVEQRPASQEMIPMNEKELAKF